MKYPNGNPRASYNIPSTVTSIGTGAFQECTNLTSITLPEGLTYISNGGFSGCTSLTEVTIPSTVTSIGMGAFNDCTNLISIIVFPKTPPSLANTAAISDATTSIYVPDASVDAYKQATNWSNFADIIHPLSEKGSAN